MVSEREVNEIARRVAGRVLAERGNASALAGQRETAHTAGVFVTLADVTTRPGEGIRRRDAQGGADLVTAASLAETPTGGTYRVPPGAIVTDLAREEAWTRRIRLVEGAVPSTSGAIPRERIAIGADHGGYALKKTVLEWLRELGLVVLDLGTHDENAVDYPDYARAVAEAVAEGRADLGICIDGAGIGSSIAANKVPGVRAALCYDAQTARNAREHNHANVLTLGGKLLATKTAHDVVRTFLATAEGGDRHARRVEKITAIERDYGRRALRQQLGAPSSSPDRPR